MKGFLEEYGLIIVVIAVILILLFLGTEVGQMIGDNVIETIKNLFDKSNDVGNLPTIPGAGA